MNASLSALDDLGEYLFCGAVDDASVMSEQNQCAIEFSREATSLETAIKRGLDEMRRCEYGVEAILLSPDDAEHFDAKWDDL